MAQTPVSKPLRIGFLLLPHASMVDYAIASEVLSRANDLAEKKLYEHLTLSLTGDPVILQNRVSNPVELPLGYAPKLDMLFILADDLNHSFPLEMLTSGLQA